jgi:hypothetical protein
MPVYRTELHVPEFHTGTYQYSSVSIVSDYGLDDREIEVRSSAQARGFFV